MKLAVDTNVLVRAAMGDDPAQTRVAEHALRTADLVGVAVPCLCEFVWVLTSVYGLASSEIAVAIRALLAVPNVEVNRPAIEAGLQALENGGDFADGAIAYEGQWLGGETFVSFDKKAVKVMKALGVASSDLNQSVRRP